MGLYFFNDLTSCSNGVPSSSSADLRFVASLITFFKTVFKFEASPDRKITTGPLISPLNQSDSWKNRTFCEAIFGPVVMKPVGKLDVLLPD